MSVAVWVDDDSEADFTKLDDIAGDRLYKQLLDFVTQFGSRLQSIDAWFEGFRCLSEGGNVWYPAHRWHIDRAGPGQ